MTQLISFWWSEPVTWLWFQVDTQISITIATGSLRLLTRASFSCYSRRPRRHARRNLRESQGSDPWTIRTNDLGPRQRKTLIDVNWRGWCKKKNREREGRRKNIHPNSLLRIGPLESTVDCLFRGRSKNPTTDKNKTRADIVANKMVTFKMQLCSLPPDSTRFGDGTWFSYVVFFSRNDTCCCPLPFSMSVAAGDWRSRWLSLNAGFCLLGRIRWCQTFHRSGPTFLTDLFLLLLVFFYSHVSLGHSVGWIPPLPPFPSCPWNGADTC